MFLEKLMNLLEHEWAAAFVENLLLSSDNSSTVYKQFNRNLSTCVLLAKDWFCYKKSSIKIYQLNFLSKKMIYVT